MRTIDGDDEPKTSSLERALENQNESVFGPDFDIIPSPRIVNGGRATRGRYPYYVSIYTDSWWGPPSHSCGGSLIAPDVVLCAAHCYEPTNPPKSVRVGAYSDNDWSNSNGGQKPFFDSDIRDVLIHPRYNTNSLNYDFALFIIDPIQDREILDSMVQIDYTGRADRNLESYDSLTAIGLGRIYTDGPLAEYLQEVELKYVDNCNRYFRWPGTITSQMMCATDRGEDSCQGDSGGPLLLVGEEDIQVGVVSWGAGGCASGTPGVYSRISAASDWIKQGICDNSRRPPSDLCPNAISGGGSGGGSTPALLPTPKPPTPKPPSPSPAPEVCQSCYWIFCWEVPCQV